MIAELQTAISNTPRRPAFDHRLTPADQIKVRTERMALLMRGAPVAIGVTVVNTLIAVAVGWGGVEPSILLGWAGLVLAVSAVRIVLWRRYARGAAAAHSLASYARIHVVGMGVNGVLWGALAPIFAVHGLMDSAFLPFMIAGMTAAALASAGSSWRAVLAFNVPALAPFAVVYALDGSTLGIGVSLIVVLYACATAYLAWSMQAMVTRSIRLRSRNDRLLGALKKQVDAAHEAEKRFRALVEASQDLTLIFSPEGKVIYASPSAQAALGAPASAFLGQTTKDIVHPDDLKLFRSVGEKALSKLGEVVALPHVCLRTVDGDYVAFGGRLTNMLYVPGVEGFVFNGGPVAAEEAPSLHSVAAH